MASLSRSHKKEVKMAKIDEVTKAIYELETPEELKAVYEAYRDRYRDIQTQASLEARTKLKKGDKVWWEGRRGKQEGVISKVNITKAVVLIPNGQRWNVPLNMLNPA